MKPLILCLSALINDIEKFTPEEANKLTGLKCIK